MGRFDSRRLVRFSLSLLTTITVATSRRVAPTELPPWHNNGNLPRKFSCEIFRRIPKFFNIQVKSKSIFQQKMLKIRIFVGSSEGANEFRGQCVPPNGT